MKFTERWVNRLIKFKWFRRSCGGHWYKVINKNHPSLANLAYWVQFKHRTELSDNIDELKEKTDFRNILEREYWGDAYYYVNPLIKKS